jgi:alpha-beta hydrolase superfamily lysophospholipase
VQVPVIVIQGQKDRLVSPASADFAEKELGRRAKIIRVPDAGHFILWQHPLIVSDAILCLLSQDRSRKVCALSRHFGKKPSMDGYTGGPT